MACCPQIDEHLRLASVEAASPRQARPDDGVFEDIGDGGGTWRSGVVMASIPAAGSFGLPLQATNGSGR